MINTIIVTNRYWQHIERMEDCHLICAFVSMSRWAWNTYTVLEGTAAAQQMRKREQVKSIAHWKSKVAQPKQGFFMEMNATWFFYKLGDFIAYTILLLKASCAKLRHSGLYRVCRSQHFWEPDFAAILWRHTGLCGRSLFGISMHVLKKIIQAKT